MAAAFSSGGSSASALAGPALMLGYNSSSVGCTLVDSSRAAHVANLTRGLNLSATHVGRAALGNRGLRVSVPNNHRGLTLRGVLRLLRRCRFVTINRHIIRNNHRCSRTMHISSRLC